MTLSNGTLMILFALGVIICNAAGSLFLKRGSKHFFLRFDRSFLPKFFRNIPLIIGIALYALSTVFFILALRFGELTLVYALTSLSYVAISFLSIFFLKEKMNLYKWIGILLVITGVILVKI